MELLSLPKQVLKRHKWNIPSELQLRRWSSGAACPACRYAHLYLHRDMSAQPGNGMLTALGLHYGPQWG